MLQKTHAPKVAGSYVPTLRPSDAPTAPSVSRRRWCRRWPARSLQSIAAGCSARAARRSMPSSGWGSGRARCAASRCCARIASPPRPPASTPRSAPSTVPGRLPRHQDMPPHTRAQPRALATGSTEGYGGVYRLRASRQTPATTTFYLLLRQAVLAAAAAAGDVRGDARARPRARRPRARRARLLTAP